MFILDLKSSKPIYSSNKILKYAGDVQAAAFVPKNFISSDIDMVWYRTTCIYFLDSNYVSIGFFIVCMFHNEYIDPDKVHT